jgi:hypothetical protein
MIHMKVFSYLFLVIGKKEYFIIFLRAFAGKATRVRNKHSGGHGNSSYRNLRVYSFAIGWLDCPGFGVIVLGHSNGFFGRRSITCGADVSRVPKRLSGSIQDLIRIRARDCERPLWKKVRQDMPSV